MLGNRVPDGDDEAGLSMVCIVSKVGGLLDEPDVDLTFHFLKPVVNFNLTFVNLRYSLSKDSDLHVPLRYAG